MPGRHGLKTVAVLAVLLAVGVTGSARAADLLVFAAASTTNAIQEVNSLFRKSSGKSAVASFGSSGTLARQIENGAPAHIFISAHLDWIGHLERLKVIVPVGGRALFANSLALIEPGRSGAPLVLKKGLSIRERLGDGRLAIADPAHTPAGRYARATLKALALWRDLASRTIRTRDVRAALALVERGEAPLGIVYTTDAAISRKVRMVAVFPPKLHPPIRYYAAIVQETDSPLARRYLAFLRTPPARAVFRRIGFDVDGPE